MVLAQVVQTLVSAIRQISHYPGWIHCKYCKNQWRYPLDGDLSNWAQEHMLKYQVLWADCEEDKPIT